MYLANASTTRQYQKNPFGTPKIAPNLTDVFSSATTNSSVAGFFDIQYRSWVHSRIDEEYEHYEPKNMMITQGRYYYYQQFLLDAKIQAIDGLLVSTLDVPGIGFRNHTLPVSSKYGCMWTEDLLWLEPETLCTTLNITFDYTLGRANARIIDRSGIAHMSNQYPRLQSSDHKNDPLPSARS